MYIRVGGPEKGRLVGPLGSVGDATATGSGVGAAASGSGQSLLQNAPQLRCR